MKFSSQEEIQRERLLPVCRPRFVWSAYLTNHTFHDCAINPWADIGSLSSHHGKSFHQLLLGIGFQEIPSCASAKGAAHQFRRLVKSQQDNLHTRLGFSNGAS